MKTDLDSIRERVRDLSKELADEIDYLKKVCNACQHNWSVQYTPVVTPARTIPGDPPGTMGVDRQFPVFVPEKTDKVWTRTCTKCGCSQKTNRTQRTTISDISLPEEFAGAKNVSADVPHFNGIELNYGIEKL